MKVKICGIMDVEAALFAVKQGADALGFVFAESKRKVTIEKAKEIIEKLPADVLKVGVFVNEKAETIEKIVEETGLTVVQLHGDETADYCHSLTVPIVKSFSIASQNDLEKIHDYPCEYVLLDSPKGKYRGGNGVTFDWNIIQSLNRQGKKIILAGGLDPFNVEEAIVRTSPHMVDVSSGVETNGRKDFTKIKQFIYRAKSQEEAI